MDIKTASATELLADIPFLEEFSPEELELLLEAAEWYKAAPGEKIITEGKLDMYMYILVMGRVELKSQNKVIGEMEAGATFGEIGLMGEKRTADVTAATPSLLLKFSAESLNRLPLTIQAIFLRRVLLDVMGRLQNVNMRTYLSARKSRYRHAQKKEDPEKK